MGVKAAEKEEEEVYRNGRKEEFLWRTEGWFAAAAADSWRE